MIVGNVVKSEQVIPVDIDGTLILWGITGSEVAGDCLDYTCPYDQKLKRVKLHRPNMSIFKERLSRGAFFLVWSASGNAKAEAVMQALGYLGHPQVLVLSKPIGYMDDIPCEEWMGPRIWLDPDSKYGQ